MSAFIQSFILGFAVTALPGAVFFEVIRRTLTHKSSIIKFLVGTFSGTFLIVIGVFTGLSYVLTEKSLARLFYGLSALVLIYIGLASVLKKPAKTKRSKSKRDRTAFTAYGLGLILGLANPISILFWISTIGKILQAGGSTFYAIINSVFIMLGAICVYLILVPLVLYSHNIFKAKNILMMSRAFGFLILTYGFFTLSKTI